MASSEFVWEQIRQACVNGMRVRRDELYTLGEPPYGWTWGDKRGLKKGERVGIVRVPGQDAVINKICGMYLSGMSIRGIARELSRQYIPAPRGGDTWSKCPVKQILTNFRNAGLVRIKTGELVPGRHYDQRIIDESTYYLIQERLNQRSKQYTMKPNKPDDPALHSKLRCHLCGHSLSIQRGKAGNPKYVCKGPRSNLKHGEFCVSANLVDSTIARAVQEYLGADDFRKATKEDVRTFLNEQTEYLATRRTRLEDKLGKVKKKFVELARNHNGGNISKDHFDAKRKELEDERIAFEAQVAEVKSRLDESIKDTGKLKRALDLTDKIPDLWKSTNDEEKEDLLSVVEYAVLNPRDMHVDLRLKFIGESERIYGLYTPGRGVYGSGIEGLSVDCLTSAYYFLKGHNCREVAHIRKLKPNSIYLHRRKIRRVTDKAALELVAPLVNRRFKDLLLGKYATTDRWNLTIDDEEYKYLQLLGKMIPAREIAYKYGISHQRGTDLRTSMFTKFNVYSTPKLLDVAYERWLIPGPPVWRAELKPIDFEILKTLADDQHQGRAAKRLNITFHVVNSLVRRLYKRYDVHSIPALLQLARERGWIPGEERQKPGMPASSDAESSSTEPEKPTFVLRRPISQRHLHILRLLAMDYTTEMIAVELGIGAGTVEGTILTIRNRLAVQDRFEAVQRAYQLGLLTPDETNG